MVKTDLMYSQRWYHAFGPVILKTASPYDLRAPPWSSGSVLDYRSLPTVFESRRGHIWRLFHLWLRFITFGGRSVHLAHHVHKRGRKTPIIIIIIHMIWDLLRSSVVTDYLASVHDQTVSVELVHIYKVGLSHTPRFECNLSSILNTECVVSLVTYGDP